MSVHGLMAKQTAKTTGKDDHVSFDRVELKVCETTEAV